VESVTIGGPPLAVPIWWWTIEKGISFYIWQTRFPTKA